MLGTQQEERTISGRAAISARDSGGAEAAGSRLLAILRAPARWNYWLALLLGAIAAVTTATMSYRMIDRELTDAALSRRNAIAQLAAGTLSEKFDRVVDVSIALATRVRFRELVAERRWAEAIEILRDVPRHLPFVERLFLADAQGTLMADVPELPQVRGQSFAYREWFQGVRKHGRPYVTSLYKRAASPQINVFAVSAPIWNARGGISGILVMQMRADTFLEWAGKIDVGQDGLVYIMDAKGQMAFHPKFSTQAEIRDFAATPIVQKLLRKEQGVEITTDPFEHEESVAAYAPVARYGWGVVAQQPTRTAFAARNEHLKHLAIAYGLVLLLCGGVAYLGSQITVQRRRAEEDQRRKAELENRVAERTAQLEAANRELESFSYSVSHDLRSPLRAIDGFSRMLEEDYGDRLDGEGKRLIGVVRENCRKMAQLISDLLAFSRVSRAPFTTRPFDATALVRQVFEELRARETETEVDFRVDPLPPATGDPALLRQVWQNLLSNAIKFSAKRALPAILVSGRVESAEVIYCVKDNGAGFDMQYYDKLFGVFQRLHSEEEFPGTGVGLAIVQRVVARHGGRVWAEGEEDKGATFYFTLPTGTGNDGPQER